MPANGKPTLKTIAQISGLAVPTVSRALNDAPDIGQKTKELVRKIAAEIGYVPNRAGVRLRTGRTNVISLVISTEHDNHTARMISSIAAGLEDTRFHLNVTPYTPQDDLLKPVRYIVETGSADAVILNQIEPEDPRVAYLMERNFPFATHGRSDWSDKHPYYDFDNAAFGRIAVDKLAARGRKSIAMICPPLQQSYSQHMLEGIQDASRQLGLGMHRIEGITSDDPPAALVPVLEEHLRNHPETDGVVTPSMGGAMATVAAAEANGKTVGQEIDVMSKEGTALLKMFRSNILTVSEAVGAAGDFLAKAAIQAVREPDLPPMQFLEVPVAD